jgi:hypothetical protein
MDIKGDYIEISNFQITNCLVGLVSEGDHVSMTNIVISDNGEQTNNSVQGGRGFQIFGDFNIINNCFSLNSNGEGINLKGSNNSQVINTSVYSDNIANPNAYYIAITGGGSNNLIENCTVYRDEDADLHRGHGLVLKDSAVNNIIRNCETYNTGIEVNFSGVSNNLFEDINIYGSYSSDNSEFSSNIRIINGAHDNTFKDITIQDCRYAVEFHDFDDGFVAPDGDRDEEEGGSNNQFINIQVNTAKNIIGATSPVVGPLAFSDNNTFTGCSFTNITGNPFFSYQTVTNTRMIECSFTSIPGTVLITEYNGGSMQIDFENCVFTNVGFPIP